MPDLLEPTLTFAFEVRVEVAESIRIGRGPQEEVFFTPITGGVVRGPRLAGEVLPYGGDWSITRPDGTELDARYLLKAEDGAVIGILNRGFWRADPEVERRAMAGEPLAETEFYYRTSPMFQTDAEAHQWLTSAVFVGMAREEEGDICIRFYELA
ncbi:DUF3237 domain-containing protein [Blastococcus sp. BMG 814]|uniref:UPF0311 protein QOZ88_13325 n=1 Tax=Blastococcus carthaginiensis TaxID=3050034 RepID=A0ABT9IDG9_9ACTN|nr:DUF3237 domain-containing protein [Blastococcus carthaginiensis]MDP5183621.1 DUF3237 domain-containing protein [Blastococcus carthaginiensis]